MWQGQRVSVVFPAYNEEAGIAAAVEDFGGLEAVDEVLVVDNNSRDDTASCALRAGARVVGEPRQGYGHALRRGLDEGQRLVAVPVNCRHRVGQSKIPRSMRTPLPVRARMTGLNVRYRLSRR